MLFISDSPKAVYLKSYLQPKLKVITDVVTDFDQGLKDVFEKRPNTVFIQEKIGGVTGESVASHIQMLLGGGAPKFILMHEGNDKVGPVKGLFEHLVDLNQPNEQLAEEIQKNLKELLGSQWYKIYIPLVSTEDSGTLPEAAPPLISDDSDAQLDELLKDAGPLQAAVIKAASPPQEPPEKTFVQNSAEECADLMPKPVAQPAASPKPPVSVIPQTTPKPQTSPTSPTSLTGLKPQAQPSPVSASASAPVAPAGFRINHDTSHEEEPIPDELLLAFEQNYRPPSIFLKQSTILIVVALLVCGCAGWYAVRQNPKLIASLKAGSKPAEGQRDVAVPPVKAAPAGAVTPPRLQTPAVVAPAPAPVEKPSPKAQLPKFIPQGGHDASYAAGHPGWERYVGPQAEFRVFSKNGELTALQVLVVKGSMLSESFIREVTGEFVGSPEYTISSREKKNGILVLSGTIPQKGDIRIYQKNGKVRAFVVSRN